jgi:putative ABC transport system ATP-binding protein
VNAPVLGVHGVTKVYGEGETAVHALSGVSLTVERGDYVAIMGQSGSGKSTLMNILGCLDIPTAGRYLLDGTDVGVLAEHQLSVLRNRKIGFIFQSFNLIADLSVELNVELPLVYSGVPAQRRKERVAAALERVELSHLARRMPSALSGGQQQRVAVARAIADDPPILLADEPTGNLDARHGDGVIELLCALHARGATVCLVTHNPAYLKVATRILHLAGGRIVADHRA